MVICDPKNARRTGGSLDTVLQMLREHSAGETTVLYLVPRSRRDSLVKHHPNIETINLSWTNAQLDDFGRVVPRKRGGPSIRAGSI